MPSKETIRRRVADRMRRGESRADAQLAVAAEFGVAVDDILRVALYSGDGGYTATPDSVTYDSGAGSHGGE